MKKFFLIMFTFLLFTGVANALSDSVEDGRASVDGKYTNLIQVMECERDGAKYGNYKDYGYWSGGNWCGDIGKAGYWVWVYPKWYVWSQKSSLRKKIPQKASVYGKYYSLKQTLTCRSDGATYGNYKDYGYWSGGNWCGQRGQSGYWVWVYPKWYVWGHKNR